MATGKKTVNIELFEDEIKENIFNIIEALSDDVLISDGSGVVIWVSDGFEVFYGIEREAALGKTVYELEKLQVFKPSIIAKVIESKEKKTMVQKSKNGNDILVTATPICGADGNLKFVISYSRDISEMSRLQRRYASMEDKVKKYSSELRTLRKNIKSEYSIVGQSRQIMQITDSINHIADFDANVLLLGESGVGKTMFAKVIHDRSNRSEAPFIDINCAAIPEQLLESEFFGYEKGAFTGANAEGKIGLIEMADNGTLLLDEISEIPLALQAKLLKAIQEKTITRVGGVKLVKVNFRLVAATNRPLEEYVKEGKFRKDLYYRLNVVNITIPPIRERVDDIIPLIDYFSEKINEKYGLNKKFSPGAIEKMVGYSWPGNVRELANVVERVIVTSSEDIIGARELEDKLGSSRETVNGFGPGSGRGLTETIESIEKKLVTDAYERHGTTTGVAGELKISQPTASRKIEKYVNKNRQNVNGKS